MNLFFVAGLTPALQLSSAIAVLSERPEIYRLLQAHPEKIPSFIEEVLRFDSVGQSLVRNASEDITLHGFTIPAGAKVMALTAAANRDAAQFPDPDQIRLDRENVKSHLAFGHGVHLCLGAALARLEMKIALEALLATFNKIECPSAAELDWQSSGITRWLRSLPTHLQ